MTYPADESTIIVTRAHMRTIPGYKQKSGYCGPVARKWFARHGFDWWDFVQHGIDAEKLLATGCPLAKALVDHAKQVEAKNVR